jgi:hypothetical protein
MRKIATEKHKGQFRKENEIFENETSQEALPDLF